MNTPHTGYNKEEVERSKWGIQRVLGVLNPRGSPLNENLSVVEGSTLVELVASGDIATTSAANDGASSACILWFHTEY